MLFKEKKIISKKSKKKIKKISEGRGIINGYFTFNNTILNLSKENGEVLTQCSGGSLGFKGSKKSTFYVAQKIAKEIIKRTLEYGINTVKIQVKKIGAGRDAVIREILETKELKIEELIDKTPVVMGGGTRSRKKPRK